MIRFACPACGKVLKAPDHGVGRKIPCPRCGQRLLIPPPVQVQNKTILGQPMPDSAASPPHGQVLFNCPGCSSPVLVSEEGLGRWVECPNCRTGFAALVDEPPSAPYPPSAPRSVAGSVPHWLADVAQAEKASPGPAPRQPPSDPFAGPERLEQPGHRSHTHDGGFGTDRSRPPREEFPDELGEVPHFVTGRNHSGLGIASFLIALLVGGLDVILILVIVVGMARPSRHADMHDLKVQLVGGGLSMYCLNCMSVPLCLVGVGLAVVGLIADRNRNHLFTWIGLLGNSVVILGVVGLYVLGAMLGD